MDTAKKYYILENGVEKIAKTLVNKVHYNIKLVSAGHIYIHITFESLFSKPAVSNESRKKNV